MTKGITFCLTVVLLLGLVSWHTQSGLAFPTSGSIRLSVKSTPEIGDDAALWVRNLSSSGSRVSVGIGSESDQERFISSEAIAGATMMQLSKSLPEALRRGDDLLLRSDEQVAAVVAPVDLPIDQSEFYYYQKQQDSSAAPGAPNWVRDLAAVGKSGANVLKTNDAGYAPVITLQSENGKRYMIGVGVALRKANSSVEIRLIDQAGQAIKSLELTGPARLHWRADLGEFISGADDFPRRIEMKVLAGKAQAFISIKDLEINDTSVLPVAPMKRNTEGAQTLGAGPNGGGYASFTKIYASPSDSYYYVVTDGPPNTCGTLKLLRNGVFQTGGNWICTDSTGAATKGPWTGSKTETGQSVRIEWPDGTTTYGGDFHIDDNTYPSIGANQSGGVGIPMPTSFNGTASDPPWGTGFKFGTGGWSPLYATFRKVTPGTTWLYWDGTCYCSLSLNSQTKRQGTSSPPAGGANINWSVTPPPSSAHTSTDKYEWCIFSGDYFYKETYCFSCHYFYGPR